MCAFMLRIEQDLRESRCSGHESRGGERPQRLGLIEGLLNLSGCSLVDRTLSLLVSEHGSVIATLVEPVDS